MSESRGAEWLVAHGGEVMQGRPLYSLETEKSVREIEAVSSGALKILKPAGESCPVGTGIGEIA